MLKRLKSFVPKRDSVWAVLMLVVIGAFWLIVGLFMISMVLGIIYGLFVYILPAALAIGLAAYLLYSLAIILVSAPFAFVIFLIGLAQGQRSSSFHRTRNIFAGTIAILIVADTFDTGLLTTNFARFFSAEPSPQLNEYLPGIWAILALATYFHLMRQVFFDGFEVVNNYTKKKSSFWGLAKWPPVSLIGILSDFALPSVLIMAFVGENAVAFDQSLSLTADYLNNGISKFALHYFGLELDAASWWSRFFDSEGQWFSTITAFVLVVFEATKDFIEYWYRDFL